MWGILFVIPNLTYLWWSGNWNKKSILVFSLVCLWALRLSAHIAMRHDGTEDYRYQAMRRKWEKKGKLYYYVAAFFYVFILQAFFSLIVNASALHVSLYSTKDYQYTAFDYAGLAVFILGFLIQASADASLQAFKSNPENKGKIIKHNVWRYSRHPNYFGEALMWWGVYLIACNVGERGYLTFYSAMLITLLVRFVSGVPLLEKKQKKNPEFLVYMKETNVFVPWFYRELSDYEESLIK